MSNEIIQPAQYHGLTVLTISGEDRRDIEKTLIINDCPTVLCLFFFFLIYFNKAVLDIKYHRAPNTQIAFPFVIFPVSWQ